MKSQIFKILITLFFFPFLVQAADSLDIVVNEIAWMGTEISSNDEWIELYNNTNSSVNLENWTLKAEDGVPEINLTGIIPAKSFYLLERTDDGTVPGISADLIYKGALGNNGEHLKLYDDSGKLIDEVNCNDGWLDGKNETKQTMERIDFENWVSSRNSGGTPKTENSKQEKLFEAEPQANEQPTENGSLLAEPISYAVGIVFSEILPSPEGPDAENEWIEIFNQNDFEVDLSKWQISDTIGKTTTYTFLQERKIKPKGFLVLSRLTTKITLNNSGDGLKLIQPDGNIIDALTYEKAFQGQSYNQIPLESKPLTGQAESGWAWSKSLTPGLANLIPSVEAATEIGSPEIEFPEEEKEKLAAIGESIKQIQDKQIPEFPKSLSVSLIALTVAIFSGAVILALKKKLKMIYNKV